MKDPNDMSGEEFGRAWAEKKGETYYKDVPGYTDEPVKRSFFYMGENDNGDATKFFIGFVVVVVLVTIFTVIHGG